MIKRWLTNNLGLKILALGFAVVTWIYVNGELVKFRLYESYAPQTWRQH